MPPIEVGAAQSVGAIPARPARPSGGEELSGLTSANPALAAPRSDTPPAPPSSTSPSIETSDALDPGAAPVDTDRVAVIRKAVETGTYPLVPTKIADAMIAAGVLLRSHK